MKKWLPFTAFIFLMAGCATHYYQIEGSTLVLYLDKPNAQQVILACSLDNFKPHEARQVNGLWEVSLPSNNPFRYYYILDGKIFLPSCRMKENDDFGSENCIFDPQIY